MKKISVIITLYNEELIVPCVVSILSQTLKPDEIIVVDDCSTDGSVELIKNLPVTLLKTDRNSGPVVGKNIGIANSKGDLLVFVDADCLLFSDWIECAAEAIELGYDGITGLCIPADDLHFPTKLMWCASLHTIEGIVTTKDTLSTSNCMYKREIIEKCGSFDETDDRGLTIKARSYGYRLGINSQCKSNHYSSRSFFHALKKDFSYGLQENPFRLHKRSRGFNVKRFIFSLSIITSIILAFIHKYFIFFAPLLFLFYYLKNYKIIIHSWSYVGVCCILLPFIKMIKIMVWSMGVLISPIVSSKKAKIIYRDL